MKVNQTKLIATTNQMLIGLIAVRFAGGICHVARFFRGALAASDAIVLGPTRVVRLVTFEAMFGAEWVAVELADTLDAGAKVRAKTFRRTAGLTITVSPILPGQEWTARSDRIRRDALTAVWDAESGLAAGCVANETLGTTAVDIDLTEGRRHTEIQPRSAFLPTWTDQGAVRGAGGVELGGADAPRGKGVAAESKTAIIVDGTQAVEGVVRTGR